VRTPDVEDPSRHVLHLRYRGQVAQASVSGGPTATSPAHPLTLAGNPRSDERPMPGRARSRATCPRCCAS
jgi:hypothetical protein